MTHVAMNVTLPRDPVHVLVIDPAGRLVSLVELLSAPRHRVYIVRDLGDARVFLTFVHYALAIVDLRCAKDHHVDEALNFVRELPRYTEVVIVSDSFIVRERSRELRAVVARGEATLPEIAAAALRLPGMTWQS
jgi:hypothetical protein